MDGLTAFQVLTDGVVSLPAYREKKNARQPIPKRLRFDVLRRDRYTCQYCGRSAPEVKLHVDHVVPVARGGRTVLENLRAACEDCNLGKGTRSDGPPGIVFEPVCLLDFGERGWWDDWDEWIDLLQALGEEIVE
jgi:hypothetical protein